MKRNTRRDARGRFLTLAENIRRAARQKFRYYKCRCVKCWGRKTLKRLPTDEKCSCGGPLRVDWHRTTKVEQRRAMCRCEAWEFPHRFQTCRWGRGRRQCK